MSTHEGSGRLNSRRAADALAKALAGTKWSEDSCRSAAHGLLGLDASRRSEVAAILDDRPTRRLPQGEGTIARDDIPSEEETRTFVTLTDLLRQPELLSPPEEVVPRIAYRGRAGLIYAEDKAGKSTLMRHAAAAVTLGGSFLGGVVRIRTGRVVWLGFEEALNDAARGFHAMGADPALVSVLFASDSDVLQRTDAHLTEWPSDLVVIDSLAEYARRTRGEAPDDGDSSGWGGVVRPIVELARRRDTAVVLLHHSRRNGPDYRGSGEIAAAVDFRWAMTMPAAGDDPTVRRFSGRGRWPMEDWSARLFAGRYELGEGGPLSTDDRLLNDIRANPGTSRNGCCMRVGGKKANVLKRIAVLIQDGRVVDRGGLHLIPASVPASVP